MQPDLQSYTVQKGETGLGIAKKYGLTPQQFLQYNPNFAAKGNAGDFEGISGLIQPGQSYTIPKSQLFTSSTPARLEVNRNTVDLAKSLSSLEKIQKQFDPATYSDSYTFMLDKMGATSDAATRALIGNIQANRMRRENEIRSIADTYSRGLQLLGIQTNQAQATPELLAGRIKSVEDDKMAKISQLDVEEQKALADANQARIENNFKLLKEKMDYVKTLRKEKLDELKSLADEKNDRIKQIQSEVNLMASYGAEIANAIAGISREKKQQALQNIADQFGVSLEAVVLAASEYAQDQKPKSTKSTGGGGYTSQELRKLRQAGIDPTDIEAADDYLYGKKEKETSINLGKPSYSGESLKMTKRAMTKLSKLGVQTSDITQIQNYLGQGYSLKQIAQATDMPDEIYQELSKYIK